MANEKHLEVLKQGVGALNRWRWKHPGGLLNLRDANLFKAKLYRANLSHANLSRANLEAAKLHHANLSEAKLNAAKLYDADLSDADLSRANLEAAKLYHANLTGADLSRADLTGANLTGANLVDTKLVGADLCGTKLEYALLGETIFSNTRLVDTEGLSACKHVFPCTLDHRTLIKSGELPTEFTRGCGLHDWQVESAKLLNPKLTPREITEIVFRVDALRSESRIIPTNLFISYSHWDAKFADHLQDSFKERRILSWRDAHEEPAGPLDKIVSRAMRDNPTVLLVLSERSVEKDWVKIEARKARELEKDLGRHVLYPIALDDSWKTSAWSSVMRGQVKKANVLNFSQWEKPEAFCEVLNRLLSGIEVYNSENDGDAIIPPTCAA